MPPAAEYEGRRGSIEGRRGSGTLVELLQQSEALLESEPQTRMLLARRRPSKLKSARLTEQRRQNEYMDNLLHSSQYVDVLVSFGRKTRVPTEEVQKFTHELFKLCWQEARKVVSSDDTLAELQDEVLELKQKLNECNLNAIRQTTTLSTRAESELLGDQTVVYHEPLHYLEPEMRVLLLRLVDEKIRQMENETAPPSFLRSLAELRAPEKPGNSPDNCNEVSQLKTDLEDMRSQRDSQTEQLQEAKRKLSEAKARLSKWKADIESLHEAKQELQAKLASSIADLKALRDDHSKAKKELKAEREAVEQLQRRLQELEAEMDILREALARNNTRELNTQTEITGKDLGSQAAETKRLKVIIEELQQRIKELVEQCKEKGMGKHITGITKDVGLVDVIETNSVFGRLYDDAMDRVNRIEQLREKLRLERAAMPGHSPVVELAGSVLEQVENSDLEGVQSLGGRESQVRPGQHPFGHLQVGRQPGDISPRIWRGALPLIGEGKRQEVPAFAYADVRSKTWRSWRIKDMLG